MKKIVLLTCGVLLVTSLQQAEAASPNPCGMDPRDWCTQPSDDDPCSHYANAQECKADPKCYGVPYSGESVTACYYDGRNFSANCPTVGCTSKKSK
jgi:hypothetical protein